MIPQRTTLVQNCEFTDNSANSWLMEIIDLPNVSVKNSSFSSNNTKFRDINTQALKAFIENEESYITREYETSYEPI